MIIKNILLLHIVTSSLFAFDQIVVVLADSMKTSNASLQRYELSDNGYLKYGSPISVNLGKKGLAWKRNPLIKLHNPQYKKEGDLKAPAGVFKLTTLYGYQKSVDTQLDYIKSSDNLICIDDVNSKYYNKIRKIDSSLHVSSFEWMKRDDNLYKYALVVDYNAKKIKNAGSCIFMHIEKSAQSATAGCSSMSEDSLQTLVNWLDKDKQPLLVQIPKTSCLQYQRIFDGIDCS